MAKNSSKKHNTPAGQPRLLTVVSRAPRVYRKDISDWQAAKQAAIRVDNPRLDRLQDLYTFILDDAHLSSQLQLRMSKVLGSEYALVREGGDIDEDNSKRFVSLPATRRIMEMIMEAQFFGYSVVELTPHPDSPDPLTVTLIDRRHIVPTDGVVLLDTSDTDGINYREMREFGTYILEFGTGTLGLLDKAVPHVLFKRFAQSCWSEFCEVCGMPPRVIKTNTQDPDLRLEYTKMLSEMGSGANGLLDIDDEMIFVNTNAGDGAAYENLIRLCSNELSLLINGAVLGQDTRYGSNSKEETSSALNDEIVVSDQNVVEVAMNTIVLPAFVSLGIVPAGLLFRFREQEDSAQLFNQTIQAAQYFDIDPEWFKEKFGIEVLGPRTTGGIMPAQGEDKSKEPKKHTNNTFEIDPFV